MHVRYITVFYFYMCASAFLLFQSMFVIHYNIKCYIFFLRHYRFVKQQYEKHMYNSREKIESWITNPYADNHLYICSSCACCVLLINFCRFTFLLIAFLLFLVTYVLWSLIRIYILLSISYIGFLYKLTKCSKYKLYKHKIIIK